MAKIRQFNIFYYNKVCKMLSYISSDEKVSLRATIIGALPDIFQNFLPLFLRNKRESFIAINDESVKAFISLEAASGNSRKWFIKKLFLDRNSFEEGKQLIDFVVAKYGALGADTFCVLVDEADETSAGLFSKQCGFRLCSREIIYETDDYKFLDTNDDLIDKNLFEIFKNSNSKEAAEFYKEALFPHFRFSLEKDFQEFKNSPFNFYFKSSVKKLFLKENNHIYAFIEIQNCLNNDKIIDLIVAKSHEYDYFRILKSIIYYIKQLNSDSKIYVLCRNYIMSAKVYESFLKENNFKQSQAKFLFVKDFYKPVDNTEVIVNPSLIFKEISGNPAFLSPDSLQKYH